MGVTVDLDPDPEAGLSGDQHLTTALEEFVDDISAAHSPGIYVLELSIPQSTDYEKYAQAWLEEHEVTPKYLDSIAAAEKLLYVGAAKNVYERLQEHLESPNRSTSVAAVFPIHSIKYIHWCDSAEEAFTNEGAVATDLQNTTSAHVHSR